MQRQWRSLKSLTTASVKMYSRNVTALFFTLFIPILLILIFGALNFEGGGQIRLSLVNQSKTELAQQFESSLKKVEAFEVAEATKSQASTDLEKGDTDLEVVIPASFGQAGPAGLQPAQVEAFFNRSNPQTGQTAGFILQQLTAGINQKITGAPTILSAKVTGVSANDQGYIDFLIPGIVAMSIMQLGIFSVAFAFVSYKTSGILRRLRAAPVNPFSFLIAESVSRVVVGVVQVVLLMGIGILLFDLTVVGSLFNFLVASLLGVIVFLAFGFTVAGWGKNENQVAPLANLIAFPQMFLSGVFFPRDTLPEWLANITQYLPLSYLSDALHKIANEGAGLWAVRGDLIGLAAWGVAMYIIATKSFRWE